MSGTTLTTICFSAVTGMYHPLWLLRAGPLSDIAGAAGCGPVVLAVPFVAVGALAATVPD